MAKQIEMAKNGLVSHSSLVLLINLYKLPSCEISTITQFQNKGIANISKDKMVSTILLVAKLVKI
jgi:hypothetical protein